jgi:hypothetical protein
LDPFYDIFIDMKIVKLYEAVITEAEVTSCVKAFGKQLFGQELGGVERDTKIEKNYANLIAKFSSEDYGKNLNPAFIQAVQNLKGCVGQYKDVLLPENTKIYRGLMLPLSYFIENRQPIITKEPFDYFYKATAPIQSWTVSPDIASIFGNNDEINELGEQFVQGGYNTSIDKAKEFIEYIKKEHFGLKIAVLLEYKTNKNDFLFKSKYFKILSNNTHEDEVLRINNKPTTVKAKFNFHEDVFLTHSGLMLLNLLSRFI